MLLFRLSVVISSLRPVNGIPPGFDVIRPAILVLQVIGVLPDIEAEHGLAAVEDGIVLIGAGFNDQLAVANQQPGPAGAKAGGGGLTKLGFEVREAAKGTLDGA